MFFAIFTCFKFLPLLPVHSKNISFGGFESGNSLCHVTLTHSQDVNVIKLQESLVNFREDGSHLMRNSNTEWNQQVASLLLVPFHFFTKL